MAVQFRSKWEALTPGTKRFIAIFTALGAIVLVSALTQLLRKEAPAIDRIDTSVDMQIMIPERRDSTLDELNASQIAQERRLMRLEQLMQTQQKGIQDALRDLQAQINERPGGSRELQALQGQVQYITSALRRMETKSQITERKVEDISEVIPAEGVTAEQLAAAAAQTGLPGGVVVPMPSPAGAPGADGGTAGAPAEPGAEPPLLPDLPALPTGEGALAQTGEAPTLPQIPPVPALPTLPPLTTGTPPPAAAPEEPVTLRLVTAQTEAPPSAEAPDEFAGRRIPTSARTAEATGEGGRGDGPSTGGGGAVARAAGDVRAEKVAKNDLSVYMPAGAMFTGILLNGVDALTSNSASSNPTPMLIRVKREAIVPNHFTVDIRECFVIASGYGRMSTERMEARTERLSCVRTDGGVIDAKLEGYVIGEDGKVGMRGRLVSRYGSLLTRATMAGLLSGFADAMKPSYVSQLKIDPDGKMATSQPRFGDIAKGGLLGGASTSARSVSDFFLDMAEETFPVIEVDAGRSATIVVLRGTQLKLG